MKPIKWRLPRKIKKQGHIICYLCEILDGWGIEVFSRHADKCEKYKHNVRWQKFKYQHKKWSHDGTPLYTNPKPPKPKIK